jgi:hypothetical protein
VNQYSSYPDHKGVERNQKSLMHLADSDVFSPVAIYRSQFINLWLVSQVSLRKVGQFESNPDRQNMKNVANRAVHLLAPPVFA